MSDAYIGAKLQRIEQKIDTLMETFGQLLQHLAEAQPTTDEKPDTTNQS